MPMTAMGMERVKIMAFLIRAELFRVVDMRERFPFGHGNFEKRAERSPTLFDIEDEQLRRGNDGLDTIVVRMENLDREVFVRRTDLEICRPRSGDSP